VTSSLKDFKIMAFRRSSDLALADPSPQQEAAPQDLPQKKKKVGATLKRAAGRLVPVRLGESQDCVL